MNEIETRNDVELVRASQRGNREALSELVRRHQEASLRLARRVLGNREDAEDEVQKAMWKAFEHLDQFQFQSQFGTWLHRIVLNQCLMRRQQLRRHPTVGMEDRGAERTWSPLQTLRCPAESAETHILRQQVSRILKQEVRNLPSPLRSVIELRDVEQLPFPLVAEELGITVSAVKSRLLRARLELRGRLLGRHGKSLLQGR